MKRVALLLFVGLVISVQTLSAQSVAKLRSWAERADASISTLADEDFSHSQLSRKEVDEAISILESKWRQEMVAKHRKALEDNQFEHNGQILKIKKRIFGKKPADGRSLYISMHGGGGAPKAV